MDPYEQFTRAQVMARDKYRCVLCNSPQIQIHEIVPRSRFGKLRSKILFDVKNRVCLCQMCHAEAHNYSHRKMLLDLLKTKYNYTYDEEEFQRYLN